MNIFDERASNYFESLCSEKIHPIRQKHDSENNDVGRTVGAPNRFSWHMHEQTRYAKEVIDARVQAFMETCQRITKYPEETDVKEFYDDLCAIGIRISKNIPRIYRSAISEVPAELLERCDAQSTNELTQHAGIALAPVYRLMNEGQLSSVSPTPSEPQDEIMFQNDHFVEFEEYLGKPFNSLSDLDWDKTKSFLESLPEGIERVDFLKQLARLPDDGVVDGRIADPPLHNRSLAFLRPVSDECSRLLSHHFNLTAILDKAERIEDHGQAISYLWNVLREYTKYHPSIRSGSFGPEEFRFNNGVKTEIQCRKDLQSSSARNSSVVGNTFNLSGPHSRLNVQSHDQSTSVIIQNTENVFAEIRQTLENGIGSEEVLTQILGKLAELEEAKGTTSFMQKYQAFIASAANHMSLIAPFLPALTQMLGS